MQRKMLFKIKISLILFFLIFVFNAYGEVPGRLPSNIPPKETLPSKITPASSLTQKASDLSVERIYLKDCRIHVLIKNIGSAGVSDEDYQSGELIVLVKKPDGTFEKNSFKLKDVDTKFILKTPGQQLEFDTKIKCSEQTQVKVLLSKLKTDGRGGRKEYAETLIPLKICLEEGFKKTIPATGPGVSPKVLKPEEQDKREFMMKPPEATAPKIAPSTEVIKKEVIKKEAKFKERPELKKAETIFREMEKMRGCPQHGKVYYYANGGSDLLYIWEQSQPKESGGFLNAGCYNWPVKDSEYRSYEFKYELINIDDNVRCSTSAAPGLLFIWECGDMRFFKYFFEKPDTSGKRFQIVLTVKRPPEKGGGEIIYTSGIFTLINYDIESKKYEYLQPESSVVSNPFNMELTYKDINLMTPQVIYLKETTERGVHYIVLKDVKLKFKTKDGSNIRDNKCVKDWINKHKNGKLWFCTRFIAINEDGDLVALPSCIELVSDMPWYTIEKDTLTFSSLTVSINLQEMYQVEIRPEIRFCEYTFQPPGKIIVYGKFSKDEAKPFGINIEGVKIRGPGSLFLPYLIPSDLEIIFKVSPSFPTESPLHQVSLYYQDQQTGQWILLNEYKDNLTSFQPGSGLYALDFSLQDLKKTYLGNKVKLKLKWTHYDYYDYDEITEIASVVKEFPFKNIVIFHPKLGDKLYLNRPYPITWGSSDKSGVVDIKCGRKLIATRVPDTGKYLWTPTREFLDCKEMIIEKPNSFPFIRDSSQFYGIQEVGIKIINPVRDRYLAPGPFQIMWELNAPDNEKRGKIKLYYRINKRVDNRTEFGDWTLIADNISVNENTWWWEIPNITETNKWCDLKIVWETYIGDVRKVYEDISTFYIRPL